MIKGAIFDLDGTLLDSMGVWEQVDSRFLGRRGIAIPGDYVQAVAAMSFADAAKYTIARFGLEERAEDIMEEWRSMAIEAYAHRVPLKRGVMEYLSLLKDRGVRLGVATASAEELYVPALRRCCIYDLFDAFTTLKEVSRGKGFPDIYERAAQKLGLCPQECAVFEDILAGVKGARDGGFFTVAVYDAQAAQPDRIRQLADRYIEDFTQAEDAVAVGREG